MTRNRKIGLAAALAIGVLAIGAAAMLYPRDRSAREISLSALSGGDTTVHDHSLEAFARPAANLPTADFRLFTFGNKMFNTNWVEAPASVTSLDGLGPTFNRVSCSGCHFKDGRGRPPIHADEGFNSMLLRLSIPGEDEFGGPKPHPAYGGQLNDKSIPGVPAEGTPKVLYEEIKGAYADGTEYSLRKPRYVIDNLAFGELGKEIMVSPRVAPAVFGLGLLEAIPESQMKRWADPDDRDGDGISGRLNYVWDSEKKAKAPGRFGWKANVATLRQQDGGAAVGDIGITTSINPEQNCPAPQTACARAISGGENGGPEMSDMQLDRLEFYSQTLAVPARRHLDDADVIAGARLFERARCTACHIPQVTTGTHRVAALAHQRIQPFTDLLLHDMGEGLADHRPDFLATGSEWRTPPLWGIGLVETVNQHRFFLHDGRARGLEEAILWHGGEAEAAKEAFRSMSKEDRARLIKFLESL